MPEEFASPEEKLLRLIRGERKAKDKILPEKAVTRDEKDKTAVALSGPVAATRASQFRHSRNYSRFINISLIASLVIIAVVLMIDVISFNLRRPAYVGEVPPKAEVNAGDRTQNPPRPQPQKRVPSASSEGPELLGSRELFRASPAAAAPARIPQAPFEKTKDLSLKGIIAGDKPQAILEDEKNKKSYFLYKGDSVNDIKVEDIQSDRVILIINGEALELTL